MADGDAVNAVKLKMFSIGPAVHGKPRLVATWINSVTADAFHRDEFDGHQIHGKAMRTQPLSAAI
jgi:hypothetical protein